MQAEGWYVDPYGLHEARWFSNGAPTALVRDAGVESQDRPPDTPPTKPLEPIVETPPTAGADLLRADDAQTTLFDPEAAEQAAWDEAAGTSGGD
jgi:hypothetical protein